MGTTPCAAQGAPTTSTSSKPRRLTRPQPGFALYAVSISTWMALVSCCGTTYMLPLVPSQANAGIYALTQQITYVASYFILAVIVWHAPQAMRATLPRVTYLFQGFLLIMLGAVIVSPHPLWLLVAYGALMGVSITLGYMQWISLVSSRSTKEIETLLFIASAVSIASGVAVYFIPLDWRLALCAILIPTTTALLAANRRRAQCNEKAGEASLGNDAQTTGSVRTSGRNLLRELSLPAICSVVLVLVAPLVSTLYADVWDQGAARTMIAQAGNLVGLAALALIYFVFNKKVRLPDAYCALLPLLASTVLVGAFFEPSQRWFVLLVGDACFCIVSVLLLLNSCDIARQLSVPVPTVYGVLGGCVYLARIPEVLLILYPGSPLGTISPLVPAVLLYLLVMPAFVLPILRRPAGHKGKPAPIDQTTQDVSPAGSLESACSSLASQYHLSERQAQLLSLLAEGQGIPRIAQQLGLSENTVRTYRKTLYVALDVHSRQELVDLIHETARGAR